MKVLARENPGMRPLQSDTEISPDLFNVIIIDNDTNTYQEVIDVCMAVLGIDFEHAYRIALAVDHNGEALVLRASREEAEAAAEGIRAIGIEVRVLPAND